MIPAPDDERDDAIAISTSFAHERFHISPRFPRVHAVQIETPVDRIRTASKTPQLAWIHIDPSSLDALAIIHHFEPSTFSNELL